MNPGVDIHLVHRCFDALPNPSMRLGLPANGHGLGPAASDELFELFLLDRGVVHELDGRRRGRRELAAERQLSKGFAACVGLLASRSRRHRHSRDQPLIFDRWLGLADDTRAIHNDVRDDGSDQLLAWGGLFGPVDDLFADCPQSCPDVRVFAGEGDQPPGQVDQGLQIPGIHKCLRTAIVGPRGREEGRICSESSGYLASHGDDCGQGLSARCGRWEFPEDGSSDRDRGLPSSVPQVMRAIRRYRRMLNHKHIAPASCCESLKASEQDCGDFRRTVDTAAAQSSTTAIGRGMRKAPRGGRPGEVAPVGGVDVNPTEAPPDRSAEATSRSPSECPRQERHPEDARRIARSSSGRTAKGRGFRMYQGTSPDGLEAAVGPSTIGGSVRAILKPKVFSRIVGLFQFRLAERSGVES